MYFQWSQSRGMTYQEPCLLCGRAAEDLIDQREGLGQRLRRGADAVVGHTRLQGSHLQSPNRGVMRRAEAFVVICKREIVCFEVLKCSQKLDPPPRPRGLVGRCRYFPSAAAGPRGLGCTMVTRQGTCFHQIRERASLDQNKAYQSQTVKEESMLIYLYRLII